MEGGRLSRNPVRLVRKIARPRRREVKPLAPATVEAMRAAAKPRDATLFSVLAYAGLRPQETLVVQWGDVREKTLLIERAFLDQYLSAHEAEQLVSLAEGLGLSRGQVLDLHGDVTT